MNSGYIQIENLEKDPVYIRLKTINYFRNTFLENNENYVFVDFSNLLMKKLLNNKMTYDLYDSILNKKMIISAFKLKKSKKIENNLTEKVKNYFEIVINIFKNKHQDEKELKLELVDNYVGEKGYFR